MKSIEFVVIAAFGLFWLIFFLLVTPHFQHFSLDSSPLRPARILLRMQIVRNLQEAHVESTAPH